MFIKFLEFVQCEFSNYAYDKPMPLSVVQDSAAVSCGLHAR